MGCTCSGQKEVKEQGFYKGKHNSQASQSTNHIVSTKLSQTQYDAHLLTRILNYILITVND